MKKADQIKVERLSFGGLTETGQMLYCQVGCNALPVASGNPPSCGIRGHARCGSIMTFNESLAFATS